MSIYDIAPAFLILLPGLSLAIIAFAGEVFMKNHQAEAANSEKDLRGWQHEHHMKNLIVVGQKYKFEHT